MTRQRLADFNLKLWLESGFFGLSGTHLRICARRLYDHWMDVDGLRMTHVAGVEQRDTQTLQAQVV